MSTSNTPSLSPNLPPLPSTTTVAATNPQPQPRQPVQPQPQPQPAPTMIDLDLQGYIDDCTQIILVSLKRIVIQPPTRDVL
jgi:hypothetical protein